MIFSKNFLSFETVMKTSEKILVEALRQFNELGIEQVSIRSIANEVGISAGNLTYHFKNTDTIIYELYLQLVEALSSSIQMIDPEELDIQWVCEELERNFRHLWTYKFILLDFAAVARRVPTVREHFRELVVLRQFQFRQMLTILIQKGLLKEEWVDGMYDQYILLLIIQSGAWIPDAEIHFDREVDELIPFYANLVLGSLLPFLTEKGIEQYQLYQKQRGRKPIRGYPRN